MTRPESLLESIIGAITMLALCGMMGFGLLIAHVVVNGGGR